MYRNQNNIVNGTRYSRHTNHHGQYMRGLYSVHKSYSTALSIHATCSTYHTAAGSNGVRGQVAGEVHANSAAVAVGAHHTAPLR